VTVVATATAFRPTSALGDAGRECCPRVVAVVSGPEMGCMQRARFDSQAAPRRAGRSCFPRQSECRVRRRRRARSSSAAGARRTGTRALAHGRKRPHGVPHAAQRQGARPIGARVASPRESRCAHSRPKAVLLNPPGDGGVGQPSLLLRVRRESEPGSDDVLACRAKWKHSRPEPQLERRSIWRPRHRARDPNA
jgi:hypothetical protein